MTKIKVTKLKKFIEPDNEDVCYASEELHNL